MARLEIRLNNSEIIVGSKIFVPSYYNSWTDHVYTQNYSTETYSIPIVEDLSFLKSKSRIYFYDNSNFPRFKLQVNNFINARIADKIDLAVIGKNTNKLGRSSSQNYIVCKRNDDFYLFSVSEAGYMFYDSNHHYINSDDPKEIVDWLVTNKLIPKSVEIIYTGNLNIYTDSEIKFYQDCQNKPYPITTDYLLDSHISQNLELLDQNSLSEIKELLSSPDIGVRGTALKMLAASNYYTNKYQVKYLLMTSKHLTFCPEWNSVSCKYMRSVLGVTTDGQSESTDLWNLCAIFNKSLGDPSNEDMIFMREKLIAASREQLNSSVENVNQLLEDVVLKNPIKIYLDLK